MNNKRDQKTYDLFQQYRFTFVLFVIVRIAGNLEAPYSPKPSVSGVHGYAPWSMAVIVFMIDETYQGIVVHLNVHRKTLEKLGLDSVPSKSTIYGAPARISQSYSGQMHYWIIASIVAGDLAGNSRGFPMRKFIPWFSVRKNSHMLKKGCDGADTDAGFQPGISTTAFSLGLCIRVIAVPTCVLDADMNVATSTKSPTLCFALCFLGVSCSHTESIIVWTCLYDNSSTIC